MAGRNWRCAPAIPPPMTTRPSSSVIAFGGPFGDGGNILGLRRLLERNAGDVGVHTADGADGSALFRIAVAVEFVAQQPDLARRGVIADDQLAVAHQAAAEARAERDAEQIAESFGAASGF